MTPKFLAGYLALCLCTSLLAAAKRTDTGITPPTRQEQPNLAAQLQVAKKTLHDLLTRFTEEHPRVKEQRRQIVYVEEQLAKANRNSK